jgi:2-polyprenyl-3-methyl-5-hydroxy-6-metoxy-1,4-benzoquinol methylase
MKRNDLKFEECYFYHTSEVPGHGLVTGEWDLRGQESVYLGGVDFQGKSVFEVGPASGYLSFWMEEQGAEVTAYDLDLTRKWDFVPFHDVDVAHFNDQRKFHLAKINNSWHFNHNAKQSKAKLIYGSVYDLSPSFGLFDIVTISSVLLHVRDPFMAIERAASVASSTIIITEVHEDQLLKAKPGLLAEPVLYLMPRAATRSPLDAWWVIPSTLTVEILKILGFSDIKITRHNQRFRDGHMWQFYTIVGNR